MLRQRGDTLKKVISAGLLGGVVLVVWTFIVNGIFGFQANIDMKQVPAERQIYEVLRQHIIDPGRYVFNPELTPEGHTPGKEPVFSVLYGGMGHDSAGGLMMVGLVVFFLAPMIGAWLLSQTSVRVRSSYPRKILFFSAIGFLLALFSDLAKYGIGRYPVNDALAFAANDIVAWILVGLVVGWRIQPPGVDSIDG